jgi:DNA helicase HerA-like ATPase
MSNPLLIAKGEKDIHLLPQMSNRHGLIAGATGTGKTVSLQVLAENFSRIGVPVFMADVKGDLAGLSRAGTEIPPVAKRIEKLGIKKDHRFESFPVVFWDIFGKQGHTVRTTISEIGPVLLARLLNLNETQSSTLMVVFKAADEAGLLLLDLKDLRAMLQYVSENHQQISAEYGLVSTASIAAIQRGLLTLEEQGCENLFGEPALNLDDFIQTDSDGRGCLNILASADLINMPKLYSTFLLWLLSELFEQLPEVGDREKPKLVFFFDEAHLLFTDTPSALVEKIEQVVRLIRSKGVGIFFVTQHPGDIPEKILNQLGNRIQHALRAFTPNEQEAIEKAAKTYRVNPKLKVANVIKELSVGEALVSFLEESGSPGVVERAFILPPSSQIGAISLDDRQDIIRKSPVFGVYEKEIDRESAYELLKEKTELASKEAEVKAKEKEEAKATGGRKRETIIQAMFKSTARSVGSTIGRQIARGVLGSIFGSKRGGLF